MNNVMRLDMVNSPVILFSMIDLMLCLESYCIEYRA